MYVKVSSFRLGSLLMVWLCCFNSTGLLLTTCKWFNQSVNVGFLYMQVSCSQLLQVSCLHNKHNIDFNHIRSMKEWFPYIHFSSLYISSLRFSSLFARFFTIIFFFNLDSFARFYSLLYLTIFVSNIQFHFAIGFALAYKVLVSLLTNSSTNKWLVSYLHSLHSFNL